LTYFPRIWTRGAQAALAAVSLAGAACAQAAPTPAAFRPPSVPLVTGDPFLSIWSDADHLTDTTTRHWTHAPHPLVSLVRIDGHSYRLMGDTPSKVPAFPQTALKVTPTRSIYDFDNGHVHVTLTFMTAALPHTLDILCRPLTYLTWQVRSSDGKPHTASLYDSTGSLLAVNTPDQAVEWKRATAATLDILRAGTPTQNYFDISGDNARLDWGYAYAAAPTAQATSAIGAGPVLQSSFVATGALPPHDDTRMPRAANDAEPTLAFAFDLGRVGAMPVTRHLIVAYDEVYAVKYFGKSLRPYWRRNGDTAAFMLAKAERDYPDLAAICAQFDQSLMADMTRIGGPQYAQMAALSYRQALAGCGLAADANGQPLLFTKENTSNGDIATVDVIFPLAPMLLLLSPSLAKASLVPIFSYAASPHWHFPNAPHDLGTYPIAKGTDDGGEGMPVEESGNMLILTDAIAQQEGNASFASQWWPQLTQWAHYLEKYGSDPEEQLCTDDFMGHLAHNANLSVKAIVALAAYGDLCRRRGDSATANRYQTLARGCAQHWMQAANDGDHYRLAFDKPGTWSQKYNLVWDNILRLHTFPASVAKDEVACYKSHLDAYGLPLDSRTHITKSDWTLWSASLAASPADFAALIAPLNVYLNQTTARVPFADGYRTDDLHSDLFHARPVIGGVFVRMLTVPSMWAKWSRGDTFHVGDWASLPLPPIITPVLATSQTMPHTWRYVTGPAPPPSNWTAINFNDSAWKQGTAPFGHFLPAGIPLGTEWADAPGDLWLRRTLTLPAKPFPHLQILAYHDEDLEVYVNGVLAAKAGGYNGGYDPLPLLPAARALLTPGATVTLAAHVHQTIGGQGVDIGLADITAR